MLFNWIRNRVRAAVLAGVADAAAEIDGDGSADLDNALAALRARVQPALPAPEQAPAESNGVAHGTRGRQRRGE